MILSLAPLPTPDDYEPPVRLDVIQAWTLDDLSHWLDENGKDVTVVITHSLKGFDDGLWNRLPSLGAIVNFGVGLERTDLNEAKRRGIVVHATTDALTADVADLAITLSVALLRQVVSGHDFVRAGEWSKSQLQLGQSVYGSKVGIVGLGRIGRAIAKRAAVFSMEIAYCGRHEAQDTLFPFYADVAELAAWADVLIAAVPGAGDTKGMIDARVIAALGPRGYFVNVSRGSVVDEGALIEALQRGQVAGAALDVFENEPAIDTRWRSLSNVVLTPHIGSATRQARRKMADEVYSAAAQAMSPGSR